MSFLPGTVIEQLDQDGKNILIRYPEWGDLKAMHEYINTLSKENVYVVYGGEEITEDAEADFLAQVYQTAEAENGVYLLLMINDKLAGICNIERDQKSRARRVHVATFAISIGSEYRGKGYGELLARRTIGEAQKAVPDLQLIELYMFGENCPARHLYQKLGFQHTGSQSHGIRHGELAQDYVWMTLYL